MGRTYRAGAYVLPFAALPTLIGGVAYAERPAPVEVHVYRGSAASPLGASLDRRAASLRLEVAELLGSVEPAPQDIVFKKMPKRVQVHCMKVVRRERSISVAESEAELDALLAGNGY